MKIIAKSYRISSSAASQIVKQTCLALRNVLQPIYLATPTTAQWKEIANDFETLWQFPNCIGAIDGKHVCIEAPGNSGTLFHDYKGHFSTILLAVCDARYRFTLADIGECGSRGDAGLFGECHIGQKQNDGQLGIPPDSKVPGAPMKLPYVFLGDETFPLLKNLMRPYPGFGIHAERRVFNYRLSRARRTI
nr:uncharacterized protein LOC126527339 [Dermacentor andersoni]